MSMSTASQLIEAVGGSDALAGVLGERPVTVRSWKHRNRIPRSAWPELQIAFPQTATLEALLETERAADAETASTPVEAHA